MRLVLASGSPRRAALLRRMKVPFTMCPSRVVENLPGYVSATETAVLLSGQKALDVWTQRGGDDVLVLGADTVVAITGSSGDEIMGKPGNAAEARVTLHRLSGTVHSVCTGITLVGGGGRSSAPLLEQFCVVTEVAFKPLTDDEIDGYVQTGDCDDKAGAYGIQGRAGSFVDWIAGDYYNVVGLPVPHIAERLAERLGRPVVSFPPPSHLPFTVRS